MNRSFRRTGRWAFAIFFLFVVAALIFTWAFANVQRQDKYLRTAIFLMAGYAGFLVWVLLGSRWKKRARWLLFGGTMFVILFVATCFRIRGVTGDLLPIVDWRWRAPRMISIDRGNNFPTNHFSSNGSYPQFLGPNRDGKLSGPKLVRDWKQNPPRELWRHAVGTGWSGFAITGQRAITQEQRGAEELIVCYDALSGREIWSHTDNSRYATTIAGEGPRATPTLAGDRVYAMGGTGVLNVLDLASGRRLWSRDTLAEHHATLPEWGVACSPLVTERAVIVTVGGHNSSLVAYDKQTGGVLWASGNDDVHWSSPIRASLNGLQQILIFSENVSSYDEQSGRLLWQYPWRNRYPHVSVPLVLSGNRLLISQGYGTGSELLEIARTNDHWHATRIWKSIRLKSKFGTLLVLDDFVYGLDDGALACIDVNSGELKWKGERCGHGQMLLIDRLLLLMAESGELILLEPNPSEQHVLARCKVFSQKTWNPLALAGDLLVLRNDREAACLRLPIEPQSAPVAQRQ